ncbi:hypothetical protein GCM10022229_24380 [Luteimonas lutimaris]|uniref:Uncharacterized protein n=1 Tax=Luteimonas lutimaris TaxID=698645 RepID=A0ABP7MTA5_9GAMM
MAIRGFTRCCGEGRSGELAPDGAPDARAWHACPLSRIYCRRPDLARFLASVESRAHEVAVNHIDQVRVPDITCLKVSSQCPLF